MYAGREGNYTHAHYTVTEYYSCLTDIIHVRFRSPVVQVSRQMFPGYSVAHISFSSVYPVLAASRGLSLVDVKLVPHPIGETTDIGCFRTRIYESGSNSRMEKIAQRGTL
jgi:hypothetical protein